MSMKKLYAITLVSVVVFFGLLAGLLFSFAGTVDYWQGWLFWGAFCLPTLVITLYFLREDPALIERRVTPTEQRPQQMVGQSIAALLFFFGIIGFPALDHQKGWSSVWAPVSVAADLLIVAGFVIVFFVFQQNTFASRAIEHMENQRTITTGLYSVVRHPMYSGASLIIVAAPLALGSLLGLATSGLLVIIVVFRLLDEEKYLKDTLEGYKEYCEKQPYRLIPFLW